MTRVWADDEAEADAIEAWLTGARCARPGLAWRRRGLRFVIGGSGSHEAVSALVRWLAGVACGRPGVGGDA